MNEEIERDQARWDEQLDRDSTAGQLDFLTEEAEEDELRVWSPED